MTAPDPKAQGACAEVLAVGMITAVGMTAAETAASVRAGVSGARSTPFLDLRDEPIVVGGVPDDHLPELVDEIVERYAISDRRARMVALGGAALAELHRAADVTGVPLFLAAPDELAAGVDGALQRRDARWQEAPDASELAEQIALQAGVRLDARETRFYAGDRAGGVMALEAALAAIRARQTPLAIVGGVDSLVDQALLEDLDEVGRLKAPGVYDAFMPGEAAAFVLLGAAGAARARGLTPLARVDAAAVSAEPGHRHSEAPYRGDGLASAFAAVFQAARGAPPVRSVLAGLNGEHFGAKEWGVGRIRHADRFDSALRLEHPIEYLGDVGAALGPTLLSLGAIGLARGYRRSPCLVWCSSDREPRGAALLSRCT